MNVLAFRNSNIFNCLKFVWVTYEDIVFCVGIKVQKVDSTCLGSFEYCCQGYKETIVSTNFLARPLLYVGSFRYGIGV